MLRALTRDAGGSQEVGSVRTAMKPGALPRATAQRHLAHPVREGPARLEPRYGSTGRAEQR